MSESRILAAGGLLWRTAGRKQLALVHRSRYDDWCLPKGKLDPGESFEAAALREVLEETGHAPELLGYLGEMLYRTEGRTKSVLLFEMRAKSAEPERAVDPDEVDELRWVTPGEALELLSYEQERAQLQRVIAS